MAAALLALTCAGSSKAASILNVPADYSSIQNAINSAANGDTVLVAPGNYLENINFGGKNVSLVSESGPSVTTIDGGGVDSVVKFASNETPMATLTGFTIRNGSAPFTIPQVRHGGGIWIRGASPTIRDNIIAENTACTGIGISVQLGSPLIENNVIRDNVRSDCSGDLGGGGIFVGGLASPTIRNNVITANHVDGGGDGGGIGMSSAETPRIEGNLIADNVADGILSCGNGGGISMINHVEALIIQNVIVDNVAGCGGGLYWSGGPIGRFLVNNTIANNTSQFYASQILAEGLNSFPDPSFGPSSHSFNNIIVGSGPLPVINCEHESPYLLDFNDIFNPTGPEFGGPCWSYGTGSGNISADPLFVDPNSGDYHLLFGSPAVDAADGSAPYVPSSDFDGDIRPLDGNVDGTPVTDMGMDEIIGDTDGDGLPDAEDACPHAPGVGSSDGCPPPGPPLAVGGLAGLVARPSDDGEPGASLQLQATTAVFAVLATAAFVIRRLRRR